ncbi:MAG: Fis family transcriptional regulator [Thermoproteales archaeon]|nr:Fis family transcriptional regulator [Thermoproteales archaeon]
MPVTIYRLTTILRAKLTGRPLALTDISDVDGIVSATLFKIKHPNALIVLASPRDVNSSWIIKSVKWDFVADLPCPGKARLRADHHKTNKPCAEREFYDPKAPCAALMALKALGLEGNRLAEKLVELARETDTANIRTIEASMLDSAVKGSGYRGKIRLIECLATRGLKCLSDEHVQVSIKRAEEVKKETMDFSAMIPVRKNTIVFFEKRRRLYYRYLSILLEERGAEFTLLIVPRGLFGIRLYVGARPKSRYDASYIASLYGGGGHKVAAGATLNYFPRGRLVKRILLETKRYLGLSELKFFIVTEKDGEIKVIEQSI